MRKLTFFLACLITIFILNVGCTQEEDSIKEPKNGWENPPMNIKDEEVINYLEEKY